VIRRRAALGALAAPALQRAPGLPALLPGLIATLLATPAGAAAPDLPFEFVALGDMPYGADLIVGPPTAI